MFPSNSAGTLLLLTCLDPTSGVPILSASNANIPSSVSATRDARTPAQIFLNCFITLLLCIWFCGRPNIPVRPPPHKNWRESWLPVIRARTHIAIWLLLSPQLILLWAVRQKRGAMTLKNRYANQGPGWTQVHGFMMNMGGFVLYKDGRPIQVLSPKRFGSLLRLGAIEFPWTTEEKIVDRGKASWALTLLFAIQTVWFVVHCIAQVVLHGRFALTLLELETWAVVVVSWVIGGVWWEKPLDARIPVRVDLKIEMEITDEENQDELPPFSSTYRDLTRQRSIQRKFLTALAEDYGLEHEPRQRKQRLTPIQAIGAALIYPFAWPLIHISTDHLDITSYLSFIGFQALNAPTFYHTDERSFSNVGWPEMLLGLVGSIIGGAHFVLWKGEFPNPSWTVLWRFCVIATTAVPALPLVGQLLDALISYLSLLIGGSSVFEDFFALVSAVLWSLGPVVYVFARVILFIIGLLLLNSLTASNVQNVGWTGYIPHLS